MNAPDIVPEEIPNLRLQQRHQMQTAHIENPGKPRLLFIHGSPGRWQDWAIFLDDPELQARFDLLAIDRPGFGGTGGPALVPLEPQAEHLTPFLSPVANILVAWSHGGPIALTLAADTAPEQVDALVLIASSMAPELEAPRWYNKLLQYTLVQAILPDFAHTSNQEMMVAPEELSKLAPKLARVHQPVYLFQGGEDGLVLPETLDYAKQQLTNAELHVQLIPEAGHTLLWSHYPRVKAAILEAAEHLPSTP